MSGIAGASLTSAQLTDARRFCGYPAYGAGASGFQSWRFFEAYGTLEYRLANLSSDEVNVVQGYLIQLQGLEAAILTGSTNLDTDQAAVWHRNRDEIKDRTVLFESWRMRLVTFLGVPPGPGLNSGAQIIV